MKRAERLFEGFLTGWMETTTSLMNSDYRVVRWLGLALGVLGYSLAALVIGLWVAFGKKPK
jgi:hypothetical protein